MTPMDWLLYLDALSPSDTFDRALLEALRCLTVR
jgi:hypothetical protein